MSDDMTGGALGGKYNVVKVVTKHPVLFTAGVAFVIALCLGITALMYMMWCNCKEEKDRDSFTNLSSNGYYYDTDNMRFVSASDRLKAKEVLIKEMAKDGVELKLENLQGIADSYILRVLDTEDEEGVPALRARLVIMVDPQYQTALLLINIAKKSNQFKSDADRQLVYDLLVKYFKVLDDPITLPLRLWSDYLLIQAFTTLKKPNQKAFQV